MNCFDLHISVCLVIMSAEKAHKYFNYLLSALRKGDFTHFEETYSIYIIFMHVPFCQLFI